MKTTRSRFTGLLLATTLLVSMGFSCRSGKDVASVPKENPRPEWMNNRPVSGSYYIGIGSASKLSQPLDYADIARKNALSDLAQGISVRVQGNTFLNSLEVNKAFSEEFISTISTSTDEQITDYEIAGQWEDKNEFWVYYRLSKAEYRAAKQARKDQAMRSAHDYYVKGLDAEEAVNVPAALDLYLHGLFALRDYWNEVNEFATDSGTVFLDNELYSSIQRLASGIEITGGSPSIVLSSENNYLQAWEGIVAYEGSPAKGITVTSSFPGVKYQKPRANLSDMGGKINVPVANVDTRHADKKLHLEVNLEPLIPADLDRAITGTLVKNMRTEVRDVPIMLQLPSFCVQSTEKNFGQPATGAALANAVRESLTEKSYRIATGAEECDFMVQIESNTAQGGTSQGFFVALLDYNFTVTRKSSGEVIFQKSETGIKGLQLNHDAAAADAYKKTKEKIKNEVIDAMLDAIL